MASYKKLRIDSGSSFAYLRTTNAYSGDFTMTLTFTLVSQYDTNAWNVPVVYWRYGANFGTGDGYKAQFMAGGLQLMRTGNEVDSNWSCSFPANVPQTVTIAMSGATITISQGGTTLINYTDPSPKLSGYYGLDALYIVADYDDVACTHFSDSFESYTVGSTWTSGQSFGPWTVPQGTMQIVSTGLRRRPIIT